MNSMVHLVPGETAFPSSFKLQLTKVRLRQELIEHVLRMVGLCGGLAVNNNDTRSDHSDE